MNRNQQYPPVYFPQQQQQQQFTQQPAPPQIYPKPSLKKSPAPAPIHQQQKLAQKTTKRSIKKSRVTIVVIIMTICLSLHSLHLNV